MLISLYIENFSLIEKETIFFENNFTAITGDTGAGKSTVLKAIDIVTGDTRAANSFLKNKQKNSIIIAEFNISKYIKIIELLKENFINIENNTILIKKVMTPNSGSKVFINDIPSNINFINKITKNIIEVSNQFEQSELFEDKSCLKMIDSYISDKSIFENVAYFYSKYQESKSNLDSIEKSYQEFLNDQEYILNMKSDFEKIIPTVPNEEEELINKKTSLIYGANIFETSNNLLNILDNNDLQKKISKMIRIIDTNQHTEESVNAYEKINHNLFKVSDSLNDIESDLIELSDKYRNTEDELNEIETRLLKLKEISKKYNISVSKISEKYEEIASFVDISENFIENQKKAKQNLQARETEYLEICSRLTNIRSNIAKQIESEIKTEILDLGMKDVKIVINFEKSNYSQSGIDYVSFKGQMNRGMNLENLKKIISGGESTRLVLALKIVFARYQSINTIIFDEIDSGVSGEMLYKIGKKMRSLSKNYQVVVITHNPQVALFADHHLYIYKYLNSSEITESKVKKLATEEVERRLAHMIYGESIDNEKILHIKNMRNRND